MPDNPINPIVNLSPDEAALILRQWLGREVRCTRVRRLTGGCVHTVLEVAFEGPESPVVLKVAHVPGHEGISGEFEVLQHFRKHTKFPVPDPLFCDISGELLPYSYMVMERVPGEHLGDAGARLRRQDYTSIEREMGEAVAELHTHTRARFGGLRARSTYEDWSECFHEKLLGLYRENEEVGLLSPEAMARVRAVLDALPKLLEAPGQPTLTHGDIWATNIMIHDGRLAGFLDPGGLFAHREYELAYLEIWRTVGQSFFEVYHQTHPYLDGYERRRMVYWLATLLIHVRSFKADHYVRATEELVSQIE